MTMEGLNEEAVLRLVRELVWARGKARLDETSASLGVQKDELAELVEAGKKDWEIKFSGETLVPTREIESCLKYLTYSERLVSVDAEHAILGRVIPVLTDRNVETFGTSLAKKKKARVVRKRVRASPYFKLTELVELADDFMPVVRALVEAEGDEALLAVDFILNDNYKYWFSKFKRNRKKNPQLAACLVVTVGVDSVLAAGFTWEKLVKNRMAVVAAEDFARLFQLGDPVLEIDALVGELMHTREIARQTVLYSTLRRLADAILQTDLGAVDDLELDITDPEAEAIAEIEEQPDDDAQAALLSELRPKERQFEEALEEEDYPTCLDLLPPILELSEQLEDEGRVAYYQNAESRVKKDLAGLRQEFLDMDQDLKNALREEDHAEALALLPDLIELAAILGNEKRLEELQQAQQDVEAHLASLERELAEKDAQFREVLEAEEYEEALELLPGVVTAARDLQAKDVLLRYEKYQAQINRALQKQALELETAEENFQIALGEEKYQEALAMIPGIVELCEAQQLDEKVASYEQLRAQIEEKLAAQAEAHELEAEAQKKVDRINFLKQTAGRAEERGKFDEARAKYEEILALAEELDDALTVEYAQQKLKQLEVWEAPEDFDFAKWGIFAFKIHNRRRYEFYKIFPSREAAEETLADLMEVQGLLKENGLIIEVIRRRFTDQGPFDENGSCFTIYYRKTPELMELE